LHRMRRGWWVSSPRRSRYPLQVLAPSKHF
jgi:hypothetical protein